MDRADLPVIAELHVDDLALEAGAPWRDAARLIEALGELASGAGARLSFRIRRRFAEGCAHHGRGEVLRHLEAQGHEVGTHSHGRGLGRAKRAVDACGVANRAATPGMVQARGREGKLWREVDSLGFAWVTDHPPQQRWTYGGLLPWRPGPGFRPDQPALGPVMIETSADPFAWGLLRREQGHVLHQHGLDTAHFQRLEGLLATHHRPLPRGVSPYFAFAIHEHNLCPEGSAHPLQASMDALEAFLRAHRVVPAGEVAATLAPPPRLEAQPELRALRLARRVRVASQPLRRRIARRPPRAGPFELRVGPRTLHARWLGPPKPRGLVLLSHAGLQGGTRTLLRPFGVDAASLHAQGIAVVAYDRSGTGASRGTVPLTPGEGVHVQDFRAVLRAARGRLDPATPVGVLSFSSGILPPLRSKEPFDFLLDGEAPADRWSLRPPHGADAPRDDKLAHLATDQDALWAGREPARLLAGIACPYHRLQAEYDHVHGRMAMHAALMLEAAQRAGLPSVQVNGAQRLALLPGRLHAHGRRIEGWLLEAFEAVESA
jgi:hypothetical protein